MANRAIPLHEVDWKRLKTKVMADGAPARELRRLTDEERKISDLCAQVTWGEAGRVGSGTYVGQQNDPLVQYLQDSPAAMAMCLTRHATKKMWMACRALRDAKKVTDPGDQLKLMSKILFELNGHYNKVVYVRSNRVFSLAEMTDMALGDPMDAVEQLITAEVATDDRGSKLTITTPHNVDYISGFARIICADLYEERQEENGFWDLPISGSYTRKVKNKPSRERKINVEIN